VPRHKTDAPMVQLCTLRRKLLIIEEKMISALEIKKRFTPPLFILLLQAKCSCL